MVGLVVSCEVARGAEPFSADVAGGRLEMDVALVLPGKKISKQVFEALG
jgi:hypothetical protein